MDFPMNRAHVLSATVAYADVDRHEVMLLSRLFKLLQDAAIAHADQYGLGTTAIATRAETWVLNRIAADIVRYPRPGEVLTVETWSTGVRGFKGIRDFRVRDRRSVTIVAASSLWLYTSLKTKSIVRVPREMAETFPVGSDPAHFADLEELEFVPPENATLAVPVSLRYADFDVNQHVNNAAYFEFVQTAFSRIDADVHPVHVRMKFGKAIPIGCAQVRVPIRSNGTTAQFTIDANDVTCAIGEAVW
jgi:acyl-ACP thioesterase